MIFTYKYLETEYEKLLLLGYKFITCKDYIACKANDTLPEKVIINRIDIDLSVKKTERITAILNQYGIKGTFFVRLHAPEYNPFSFENYRIIKNLVNANHELGYHSEIIDESNIWDEDPKYCMERDIKVLENMFNTKISGSASHGGLTGFNNLDFWNNYEPSDFGLLYEGYDHRKEFNLFHESLYISDSEWTQWKCYNKGILIKDDRRSPSEHAANGHPIIHLLIHPDTYFDRHIYE